jgi:hypothetical protein
MPFCRRHCSSLQDGTIKPRAAGPRNNSTFLEDHQNREEALERSLVPSKGRPSGCCTPEINEACPHIVRQSGHGSEQWILDLSLHGGTELAPPAAHHRRVHHLPLLCHTTAPRPQNHPPRGLLRRRCRVPLVVSNAAYEAVKASARASWNDDRLESHLRSDLLTPAPQPGVVQPRRHSPFECASRNCSRCSTQPVLWTPSAGPRSRQYSCRAAVSAAASSSARDRKKRRCALRKRAT